MVLAGIGAGIAALAAGIGAMIIAAALIEGVALFAVVVALVAK